VCERVREGVREEDVRGCERVLLGVSGYERV